MIQNQKDEVENRVNQQQLEKKPAPRDQINGTDLKSGKLNQEIESQRLHEYKKAMLEIKQATGLSDINEIILKFATQSKTHSNLKEITSQNEKKLFMLTNKKDSVKEDLQKMKLEGLEALTRKQVDDIELNLAKAEQEYSDCKDKHDNQ